MSVYSWYTLWLNSSPCNKTAQRDYTLQDLVSNTRDWTCKGSVVDIRVLPGLIFFVRSRPANPPRTVSVPNLHQSLWVWKLLKLTKCVSSLVEIYSVVHFKTNGRSWKTIQGKNVTPSQTSADIWFFQILNENDCLSVSASFAEHCWKRASRLLRNSFISSSAIHHMIIDNKHSFISSAGCHHADRISCKMTETWKLQSVVSPQPAAQ